MIFGDQQVKVLLVSVAANETVPDPIV